MEHAPGRSYLRKAGAWCFGASGIAVAAAILGFIVEDSVLWTVYNIVLLLVAALYVFMGVMAFKHCNSAEKADFLRILAIASIATEMSFFIFNAFTIGISAFGIFLLVGLIRPAYYWIGASKNRSFASNAPSLQTEIHTSNQ